MGRGAEAVEPDRPALAGQPQRTPTDQSGAEQGRQRHGIAGFAQWEGVAGIRNGGRGKAAVARITGEFGAVAEVFLLRDAIGAGAAGMAQPGDADPLANPHALDAAADGIDPADDLMTWNDRHFRIGQFAVDDMQVGAADAAGEHLDADLPGAGLSIRQGSPHQRRADRRQNHCEHGVVSSNGIPRGGMRDRLSAHSVRRGYMRAAIATSTADVTSNTAKSSGNPYLVTPLVSIRSRKPSTS